MSDQDFERRLQDGLRDDADEGVRPVDAVAVTRAAAARNEHRRGSWLGGARYVLVAAVLVVGAIVAVGLGSRLIVVPQPSATPMPTTTSVAQSPATSATPAPSSGASPSGSLGPTPTPSATAVPSPTSAPTLPPSASPTPTPTSTPVAIPTANPNGWVELAGFTGYGKNTHVTAIAYGANRFVAVGWSMRNGNVHGRIWTSADGLGWAAQPDGPFAGLSLEAVTYNGAQFYAFASAPTTVWRSTDGSSWQKVDLPTFGGELGTFDAFTDGHVAEATAVGTTMFAAGETTVFGGDIACDGTCVAAWRSTDGTDWSQSVVVDGDSFKTFASMPGLSVAVTYGSYIGKGVWYSTDFDSWSHPAGISDSNGFLDAASDGGRVVLVGYGPTADDDYGKPVALVTDGSTWTTVDIDPGTGPAEQLAWTAGRFVAVGTGAGVIASWWSTDGASWTRGPDVGPALSLNLGETPGDDPFNQRTIGAGGPGVVLAQTGDDGLHMWFAPMSAFGN